MKHGLLVCALLCLLPVLSVAQLPDAPRPNRDRIKPFALNVSVAQRWRDNPEMDHQEDTTLSCGIDYRLPGNRVRLGLFSGYTPQTQTRSATFMVTYKFFEWGHRR